MEMSVSGCRLPQRSSISVPEISESMEQRDHLKVFDLSQIISMLSLHISRMIMEIRMDEFSEWESVESGDELVLKMVPLCRRSMI